MKEAGANTIRIYHISSWTRQASIEQLGTNGIQFPIGKSHREFLDLALRYGLKVIFPLPGEEAYLRTKTEDEMYQMIRSKQKNSQKYFNNLPQMLLMKLETIVPSLCGLLVTNFHWTIS